MNRLSEGRSADPLLDDDDEESSRGVTNSPYSAIREIQEAARRRHEMRSKSPTITTTRLVVFSAQNENLGGAGG